MGGQQEGKSEVHSSGLEPLTFGSLEAAKQPAENAEFPGFPSFRRQLFGSLLVRRYDRASNNHTKGLRKSPAALVPAGVPSSPVGASKPAFPPHLARVIDAWPSLSDAPPGFAGYTANCRWLRDDGVAKFVRPRLILPVRSQTSQKPRAYPGARAQCRFEPAALIRHQPSGARLRLTGTRPNSAVPTNGGSQCCRRLTIRRMRSAGDQAA